MNGLTCPGTLVTAQGNGDVHEKQGVPQEVLQLLPSAVKGVYSHYSHAHNNVNPPTTTIPPPVVWFPDLNKGECGRCLNGFIYFASVISRAFFP